MVNTFNFSSTAFATYALHSASCANALVTFYATDGGSGASSIGAYMAAWVSRGAEIRTYNRADAKPRVPLIYPLTLPAAHTPSTINVVPMDVCMCLSYHAAPPVTRRRRGRIYLGGIQSEWISAGALGAAPAFQTGVGSIGEKIKNYAVTLMGTNVGWVVYSTVNGSGAPIVGGYIDQEPDTQRRRGNTAPARITWGT